ncbi:Serine/threonine protein kinase [Forsythia ovata]|uniref:Serine/threonine protein kinase n=1 Tax=Forsythia ovata TaxID=205694 RepID=A0ABD1WNG3_9LAMI
MDARMDGQYFSEAALQASQLTLKCLESEPIKRPSMKEHKVSGAKNQPFNLSKNLLFSSSKIGLNGQQNLVDHAKPFLSRKRKLMSIMDAKMEVQYSSNEALQTTQLSLRCLESEPKKRSSMKEVVEVLEQVTTIGKPKESKICVRMRILSLPVSSNKVF